MTREEAKELLPIIKAFAEGKIIELYDMHLGWIEVSNPTFKIPPANYRIKPEQKYRPFKTKEECWAEMHNHADFGWVKSKHNQEVTLIGRIFTLNEDLYLTWSINEGYCISSSDVFSDYTFTDGTPFGVKEE